MRRSPLRHTIAVLRTTLGLTQKEMAKLAECSVPTIQAIELGKLKMSRRIAANIVNQTQISIPWLFGGDTGLPPVNEGNQPYTRADFENAQAYLHAPNKNASDLRLELVSARLTFRNALFRIMMIFIEAYRRGSLNMCSWKTLMALGLLQRELFPGQRFASNEPPGLSNLTEPTPEDLHNAIQIYVKETERIFGQKMKKYAETTPG